MVRAGKQPAKRPARRNGDRPAPEPEPAPSPATPVDLIITTTAPSAPPAAASSSTRKQFNASAMTASTFRDDGIHLTEQDAERQEAQVVP